MADDADEQGSSTADTMRERAGASRLKLWVLIEARRPLLVAGLLLFVFVTLVATAVALPGAVRFVRSGDPVETLFQALVGATITGVTLVLTLNQLVLSQELGAVGDQRERMDGAMSFRQDVESLLDAPISPPEPASFLRALVDVAREHAIKLSNELADNTSEEFRTAVETLRDDVVGNADAVSDQLDGAQFGTFDVISAALNFNYSWKIYTARRLKVEHGAELTEAQSDSLDSLLDVLEAFGPTREHFKTLYVQWELVNLSRSILTASVPSLVVAVAVLLYYQASEIAGSILGFPIVVLALSASIAISILPFLVLLAYIVRIATITKRTLSIGPFTLRETDRTHDINWESE